MPATFSQILREHIGEKFLTDVGHEVRPCWHHDDQYLYPLHGLSNFLYNKDQFSKLCTITEKVTSYNELSFNEFHKSVIAQSQQLLTSLETIGKKRPPPITLYCIAGRTPSSVAVSAKCNDIYSEVSIEDMTLHIVLRISCQLSWFTFVHAWFFHKLAYLISAEIKHLKTILKWKETLSITLVTCAKDNTVEAA